TGAHPVQAQGPPAGVCRDAGLRQDAAPSAAGAGQGRARVRSHQRHQERRLTMAPRALVLLPDRDHGPGDYTGAFRVEADRLLHHYRLPSSAAVQVDISRDDGARARQVLAAIEEAGQAGPLELLAFICHGTRRGLQLARLAQLPGLAARIASSAAPGVAIAFYACSLGGGVDGPAGAGGDGGPADFL